MLSLKRFTVVCLIKIFYKYSPTDTILETNPMNTIFHPQRHKVQIKQTGIIEKSCKSP